MTQFAKPCDASSHSSAPSTSLTSSWAERSGWSSGPRVARACTVLEGLWSVGLEMVPDRILSPVNTAFCVSLPTFWLMTVCCYGLNSFRGLGRSCH